MTPPAEAVRTLLSTFPCLCHSHFLCREWSKNWLIHVCNALESLSKGKCDRRNNFIFIPDCWQSLWAITVPELWCCLFWAQHFSCHPMPAHCSHSSSLANEIHLCSLGAAVTAPNTSWQRWFHVFFSFFFFSVAKKLRSSINIFISVRALRSFQERMNWFSCWPPRCLCRSEMGISVSVLWLKSIFKSISNVFLKAELIG